MKFIKDTCQLMGKVEILVSFMTSLVVGKVAAMVDSMYTATIDYSPGFKFTIRSTSPLLLS